jgi:hypothetical protein
VGEVFLLAQVIAAHANSPVAEMPTIADYRLRIEIWAILGCVVLFGALIELVRRHRLKERYSFLWFITVGVMLVFTLKRDWLEDFAALLGIYYPPSALFLLLVFFMLLILIHFSTVISRLLSDKQTMVQELGILESRIRDLERATKRDE